MTEHEFPLRSGGMVRWTMSHWDPGGQQGGQHCGSESFWVHDGTRWVMVDERSQHRLRRWCSAADSVEELLSVIGVRVTRRGPA